MRRKRNEYELEDVVGIAWSSNNPAHRVPISELIAGLELFLEKVKALSPDTKCRINIQWGTLELYVPTEDGG